MASRTEVLEMLDAIDGGSYNRRDLLKVFKSMAEDLGFVSEPEPAPEPAPVDEPEVDDDSPKFSND